MPRSWIALLLLVVSASGTTTPDPYLPQLSSACRSGYQFLFGELSGALVPQENGAQLLESNADYVGGYGQ
jgi:hypothetical protein